MASAVAETQSLWVRLAFQDAPVAMLSPCECAGSSLMHLWVWEWPASCRVCASFQPGQRASLPGVKWLSTRTLAQGLAQKEKIPVSGWSSDALKDDIVSRTRSLSSASFHHQMNRCFTLRTRHHVDTGVSYSRYRNWGRSRQVVGTLGMGLGLPGPKYNPKMCKIFSVKITQLCWEKF